MLTAVLGVCGVDATATVAMVVSWVFFFGPMKQQDQNLNTVCILLGRMRAGRISQGSERQGSEGRHSKKVRDNRWWNDVVSGVGTK